MKTRVIDMTGKRFTSITGVRVAGKSSSGDLKWLFECDCGNQFEANGYSARSGKVTTCPACAAERSRIASVKHGMSETDEFSVWTDIQTRCYNQNTKAFPDYGGRGIRVCDRWLSSFENFISDMGFRPSSDHSIERNDVNGSYEPSNCRWATLEEQARNKRNTRFIDINGTTKRLQEWAEQTGLSASAIHLRIKAGVVGSALLAPSQREGSIEFNGVTDTYAGWGKRTGLKASTIAMRITQYGWSIQKALTQGVSL